MAGSEHSDLPPNWSKGDEGTFCLACRRAIAAESAVEEAPEDISREARAKLRARAVVDFEVSRDPARANGEIAKACRSSVAAVIRARERLDAPSNN